MDTFLGPYRATGPRAAGWGFRRALGDGDGLWEPAEASHTPGFSLS